MFTGSLVLWLCPRWTLALGAAVFAEMLSLPNDPTGRVARWIDHTAKSLR
jgi:hypothetical protein